MDQKTKLEKSERYDLQTTLTKNLYNQANRNCIIKVRNSSRITRRNECYCSSLAKHSNLDATCKKI